MKFLERMRSAILGVDEVRFGFGKEEYKKYPYLNLCAAKEINNAIKEFAIEMCVTRYAHAFTMADFRVYDKHKRKVAKLERLLNVSPNLNQSTFEFYHKLIRTAVYNGDKGALVLVLDINGENHFVVADSYECIRGITRPNLYKEVMVDDYKFDRIFNESEVLRFNFNSAKLKLLIDNVYNEQGDILRGAIKQYHRGNSEKLFVKIASNFDEIVEVESVDAEGNVKVEQINVLEDFFNEQLKKHFDIGDSATPIQDGLELLQNEHGRQISSKVAKVDTRDLMAMTNDIIDEVCMAFNLPPMLVKGTVADIRAATDNAVTFAFNPALESWTDEVNKKMFTSKDYAEGSLVRVDSGRIRYVSPEDMAASLEALTRIRGYNAEEIRERINMPKIGESWANDFLLTKNYEQMKDLENYIGEGGTNNNAKV